LRESQEESPAYCLTSVSNIIMGNYIYIRIHWIILNSAGNSTAFPVPRRNHIHYFLIRSDHLRCRVMLGVWYHKLWHDWLRDHL
jgi:hypothetical protein